MKTSKDFKIDREFIESFITGYFNFLLPKDFKEELYDILNLRGFLLEPYDEKNRIKLSGNSFFGSPHNSYEKADNDYLGEKISSFAKLKDNFELDIIRETNMEDYIHLLINEYENNDITRIGHETGPRSITFNYLCSFHNLKNLEYGLKVSVSDLEPFIAKFVKSVNAIGLDTSMSCQGHIESNYKSEIHFYGCYNLIWFFVVFDKFVSKVLKIKCNWNIDRINSSGDAWQGNTLTVFHPGGDIQSQYFEIIKVADFIYDNRLFLRRMKRGLQGLNNDNVINIAKKDSEITGDIKYKKLNLFKTFSSVFTI